jgi:hypothetical protein
MRFVLSMVGVVSVSVMDVIRELLFHLLHVVVEGDLSRSGFSLVCMVSVTVVDEVGELLFHLFDILVECNLIYVKNAAQL